MQHRVAGGELGREPVERRAATSARTTPRSSTGSTSSTPPASHRQPDSTTAVVDRDEDRHHALDARVRDLVLVRAEARAAGLLVVELVLERDDRLAERVGRAARERAGDQRRDPGMARRDVLGAADRGPVRRSARRSGPTRATPVGHASIARVRARRGCRGRPGRARPDGPGRSPACRDPRRSRARTLKLHPAFSPGSLTGGYVRQCWLRPSPAPRSSAPLTARAGPSTRPRRSPAMRNGLGVRVRRRRGRGRRGQWRRGACCCEQCSARRWCSRCSVMRDRPQRRGPRRQSPRRVCARGRRDTRSPRPRRSTRPARST